MGMETMLADMVKKIIPPEVMEFLTEENIKAIGEQCKVFIAEMRADMAEIKSQNAQILAFMEALENGKRGKRAG